MGEFDGFAFAEKVRTLAANAYALSAKKVEIKSRLLGRTPLFEKD